MGFPKQVSTRTGPAFALAFAVTMLVLTVGCPPFPPQDGGFGGPPSGVIEMDQNTDPRYFLRNRSGAIGWLKTAGDDVRLNGRRVTRDTYLQNGAHVRTGPDSAAIIDFYPSRGEACGLDVREFRHGRIYGRVETCGHLVITEQGAMETRGWPATYHVEARGDRETVFTAIDGEASVWRHADPERVVFVPRYHQVRISRSRITPPRRVSRAEVVSLTRWRDNFWRYKKETVSVPDLRKREIGDVRRTLERLGLGLRIDPPNAGSRDRVVRQDPPPGTRVSAGEVIRVIAQEGVPLIRVPELLKRQVGEARRMMARLGLRLSVNPPNAKSAYRVVRQSPRAGTEVRRGAVVQVEARAEGPTFTFPTGTVPTLTVPTVVIPKVTVPNLKSRSLGDAKRILERLGLGLRYNPRNAADNYWVVSQDPPAGRKVDRGTAVNLRLQVPIY